MTVCPHLGILGSGQLARMLAQAAIPLGIRISVLEKRLGDSSPGWTSFQGDWDEPATALKFASRVDVVTLENEFVRQESLELIEREGIKLFPSAHSVSLVQDKFLQKQALAAAGLPVVPFSSDLTALGFPIVLKKRRLGYDGKGNCTVSSASVLPEAFRQLDGDRHPLFAEAYCPFERELAVMITRDAKGDTVAYPVVETIQKDHICHTVIVPATVPGPLLDKATDLARRAVAAFDGIGTWGVEMFLQADGTILINEMAPRVHNSGHYTIEACTCSQFENHVRAVLGWPLGSTDLRAPAAVMVNLLGAGPGPGHPSGLAEALAVPGAHVHLYGKSQSVKGRKMGHVTALGRTADDALATAQRCAACLCFGSTGT